MLTLIVPGLIWTRQALADLTYDLPLPAFTTLLGRGRLRHQPARSTNEILAESCGLAAPFPAAALRRLALHMPDDDSEWLCLDPVRLRLTERSLVVDNPHHLNLAAEEANALAVSLAPTFAALGQLEVLEPGTWNLKLAAGAPEFEALPEAAGRAAAPLPPSPAYASWRHAINEAQILLHTHPVNQAREAAGKPVVNSLWPWGGGRLPRAGTTRHDAIWSDDPIARGIARLLRIESSDLPARLAETGTGHPLAIHDALELPARGGDALAWRDAMERFETDWLAPALGNLRSGRLDTMRLLAPGTPGSAELLVRRRDMWKFWRKPRTLTALVPA
jgi:hypothetical protein